MDDSKRADGATGANENKAASESAAQSGQESSGSSNADFGADGIVGDIIGGIAGDLAFAMLGKTQLGKGLKKALAAFESIQADLAGLSEQRDHQALLVLKAGTILTFSLIAKTRGGTAIGDFSGDDLKDIYENVSHYAIRMDGQLYSVFAFAMYADYIDMSLKIVESLCHPEEAAQVHELADDLREQARRIADGEVPEADGTETCLWLALEALMKTLCLYCGAPLGDKRQVVTALGQLAFEVGRYQLYARELEIVSQCVGRQHELDEELEQRYQAYVDDVREASTRLMSLMQDAFAPDFEERLKGSIVLAREMGVESEKILDTNEKIDAFFLE